MILCFAFNRSSAGLILPIKFIINSFLFKLFQMNKDISIIQVLEIEFILLAIDFVPLTNEFVLLPNECVLLPNEFVPLAIEFIAWLLNLSLWHENSSITRLAAGVNTKTRFSSCVMILFKYNYCK